MEKFDTVSHPLEIELTVFASYGRIHPAHIIPSDRDGLSEANPARLRAALEGAVSARNYPMIGVIAGLALAGSREALIQEPPQLEASVLFRHIYTQAVQRLY